MKIDLTTYLKKVSQSVSLSASEKEKMAQVLSEYMALKPLPAASGAAIPERLDGPFSAFGFGKRPMAFALTIALLLSSSVSYAAEGSLPGDLLYPVKVSVNEEVRGAFAVSTEAKVEWDVRRAERRLEEGAQLAREGRLTSESENELSERFDEYAGTAVENLATLGSEDVPAAIAVASSFETRLAAHGVIFSGTKIEAEAETDAVAGARVAEKTSPKTAGKIKNSIRDKASKIARIRGNAEEGAAISSQPITAMAFSVTASAPSEEPKDDARLAVAARMGELAKKKVKTAAGLFDGVRVRLDAAIQARTRAELERANTLLAKGDTLFASNDPSGSFHAYQEALVIVEKLSVYIKSNNTEHIRDSENTRSLSDDTSVRRASDSRESTDEIFEVGPLPSLKIFPDAYDEDENTDNDWSVEIKEEGKGESWFGAQ